MSELPDNPLGLDLHDLDTSIGIVFEGYVITTVLYGLIFFEVYIYFERYAKDSLGWKSTVCSAIFELSLKRDFENQMAILFCIDSTALAFLTASHKVWFPAYHAHRLHLSIQLGIIVWIQVVRCYVFQIWTCAIKPLALIDVFAVGNNRVLAAVIVWAAARFAISGTNLASPVAGSGNSRFRARLRISQPLFNSFSQHPFKVLPKQTVFDGVHEYLLSRGGAATILQVGQFITFVAAPSKHYWMIFALVTRRVHGHGNPPLGSSSNTARGTQLSDMSFAKVPSAKSQKYQNTLHINVSRTVEDGMNDCEDPEIWRALAEIGPGPAEASRPISAKARQIWTYVAQHGSRSHQNAVVVHLVASK
ncbi:hypothetical protein B0H13DRAFT_1879948 [Mycena leptocephala]|nr:hypothetical protein B0H13DRAFT_1879948 [Mycena leptocephala]